MTDKITLGLMALVIVVASWPHVVPPERRHALRRWAWGKLGRNRFGKCHGCGVTLTPDERKYYGSSCETCEGVDMERGS